MTISDEVRDKMRQTDSARAERDRKRKKEDPEFHEQQLQKSRAREDKYRQIGTRSFEQHTRILFKSMRSSTKARNKNGRNHCEVEWKTLEEFREYAREITEFRVNDRVAFQLQWTNGFPNTVSMQRWDDSIGYTRANAEPIPVCLNTSKCFTKQDLANFISNIVKMDLDSLLLNVNALQTTYFASKFTRMVVGGNNKSVRGHEVEFADTIEVRRFICEQYVRQGGLCAYTGAMLHVSKRGDQFNAFTMSMERRNPMEGYTKANVLLVCQGVNGIIPGPYYENYENEDDIYKSIFDIDYWKRSIGYTAETDARIDEIRTIYQKAIVDAKVLRVQCGPITKMTKQEYNFTQRMRERANELRGVLGRKIMLKVVEFLCRYERFEYITI
jgi:hypothetical protein